MLILSDFNTNCYSFDEPLLQQLELQQLQLQMQLQQQQEQQQQQQSNQVDPIHLQSLLRITDHHNHHQTLLTIPSKGQPIQEIIPHIFFGQLPSSLLLLQEQAVKIIIFTCNSDISTLKAIHRYNSLNTNSILMLILCDENFNVGNYCGEELEIVVRFQMQQNMLLQEINNSNTMMTTITSPFITMKLYQALQKINFFVKKFRFNFPNLSVLFNFNDLPTINHLSNGYDDDHDDDEKNISTMILISYLLCLKPKSNISTCFNQLQNSHGGIDSKFLTNNPYYKEMLLRIWESNYLSISGGVEDITNNNNYDNDDDIDINDKNDDDDLKNNRNSLLEFTSKDKRCLHSDNDYDYDGNDEYDDLKRKKLSE